MFSQWWDFLLTNTVLGGLRGGGINKINVNYFCPFFLRLWSKCMKKKFEVSISVLEDVCVMKWILCHWQACLKKTNKKSMGTIETCIYYPYQHGFHTKGLVNPIAKNSVNKYVVIQFYSWFAFSSLLVEIYYDNHTLPITQEQRKIKCKPRIKLNHIILHVQIVYWRSLNRNSSRNLKWLVQSPWQSKELIHLCHCDSPDA